MLRTLTAMLGLMALVSCGGAESLASSPARAAAVEAPSAHAQPAVARGAAPSRATGQARGPRKAAPARTAPAAPGAPAPTVSKSGIVPTGTNSWNVPKAVVTKYTNNPNALGSQASVAQVDSGWRIKSVKSGTDVAAMGVHSGDVVTRVNGYSVDGTLNTWWAAQHLKNQSSYRVSILRGGKPMLLKYKVVN